MAKYIFPKELDLSVSPKHRCRLLLLGSPNVGKTCIVHRFLCRGFLEDYNPTTDDIHRMYYRIRGKFHQLDILDPSGHQAFPATQRLAILNSDMFILVFSLDNHDSFEEVQRLKHQIIVTKSCLKNKSKESFEVPLVICGNKVDRDFCRTVQSHEIEQLVGVGNNYSYFEVSAKNNVRLQEMFQALFTMAKLPIEMSPGLHFKVSIYYREIEHKKLFMGKKAMMDGDAYGTVAPFTRRPSVNSELIYIREKAKPQKRILPLRFRWWQFLLRQR
ncbi:dexamethasone-induced Ras-related protein 1-like [Hyperolius riggenbachi]|uniref:dexamethasone-induced Ras-related protein 1-like n=1 Tax=Hyperolius riggenbachi TaxID=752182 RepID=UPI0035A2D235